jgi:hypothetical protein
LGFALSLFFAVSAQGADKKPAMSEEMQAMMAKAKEAGTPGAEHAILKPLEGSWNVTGRSWMKPTEKKPTMSSGTSTLSWVMGGRFLKQEYKGDMMGQPFEGLGYMGYDKVKKEYVSVWMDSMATGLFEGSGSYDATTKTVGETGNFSCPVTGDKDMWYRSDWKMVDNDTNVFTMYMKDPNGKEFKSMELTYKRAK